MVPSLTSLYVVPIDCLVGPEEVDILRGTARRAHSDMSDLRSGSAAYRRKVSATCCVNDQMYTPVQYTQGAFESRWSRHLNGARNAALDVPAFL